MADLLFKKFDLSSVIRSYEQSDIEGEISSWSEEKILNVSEHEHIEYFRSKYRLDVPTLVEGGEYVCSDGEAFREMQGHRGLIRVPEHFIEIAFPFEGDPDLFGFRGSSWDTMPPRGDIVGQELRIRIQKHEMTKELVEKEKESFKGKIEKYLGWLRGDCEGWNDRIASVSGQLIATRKERFLKKNNLVESLGLPIKRRGEVSGTVKVPLKRKTINVRPTVVTPREKFAPEPAIELALFDDIMAIIERLSLSIERSPSIFMTAGEEQIRDILLVDLNGHFEGAASGETFNREGKTDILIRSQDRNVFIAECKIWKGPKSLSSAIDQLLGYLTWRDTKAAIVVFSKTKDFGTVVSQIDDVVSEHPSFIRSLDAKGETHFRYVFSQRDDSNRAIHLAVVVFDLPS